jgi:hypothetical protein
MQKISTTVFLNWFRIKRIVELEEIEGDDTALAGAVKNRYRKRSPKKCERW